jgi:hypothetical protein
MKNVKKKIKNELFTKANTEFNNSEFFTQFYKVSIITSPSYNIMKEVCEMFGVCRDLDLLLWRYRIEAKSITLKKEYTIESVNDSVATYGLEIETELLDILSAEIQAQAGGSFK